MPIRTRLLFSAVQIAVTFATVPALAQAAAPPDLQARFEAANTTHDGRLTLAQAQAGHMRGVARDFAAIDAQNKGYVTVDDLRAYHRGQRAARAASANPTDGVPR